MSADDARAAILDRYAGAPADESPADRRRRRTRERMRRLRARRAAAQEALRAETREEYERESVTQAATDQRVGPARVDEPVRRSGGDGKLLGAVHGWGGSNPTVLSFAREKGGPPANFEEWLAIPRAEPERPVAVSTPQATFSFFLTDGVGELARVAARVSEETGIPENDVRERLSRAESGGRVEFA